MLKRLSPILTTVEKPVRYWIIGSALLWLILPVSLVDIALDPQHYAPHWQCDSFGAAIIPVMDAMLPWTLVSIILVAILVFPLATNKVGGTNVFTPKARSLVWNGVVSVPILLISGFLAYDVMGYLWDVIVPQTYTADCGGRAEPITITRRRRFLQFGPFLELCLILWLSHLRALALAPRKNSAGN